MSVLSFINKGQLLRRNMRRDIFFDHKISLMVQCVRRIRAGWMCNFPPYLEFNC